MVDGPPGLTSVIGAESARRRDGDEDAVVVGRVDDDRVQAEPAGTGRPSGRRLVSPNTRQLGPALAGVFRLEERSVLGTRVHGVGVVERRLEVPHPLELVWMRRCVVPRVRSNLAFVEK